jgi:hypothetical protein
VTTKGRYPRHMDAADMEERDDTTPEDSLSKFPMDDNCVLIQQLVFAGLEDMIQRPEASASN